MTRDRESTTPRQESFVETLRRRSEEAAAASVHHASLSQQYLLLSQKYATLADQAINPQFANDTGLVRAAETIAVTLEQESRTGIPSTAFPFSLERQKPTAPQGEALRSTEDKLPEPVRASASGESTPPEPKPQPSPTTLSAPEHPSKKPKESVGQESSEQAEPRESGNDQQVQQAETPSTAANLRPKKQQRRRKASDPRQVAARSQQQPASTSPVQIESADDRLQPQHRTMIEELRRNRSSLLMSSGILTGTVILLGMIHFEIELPMELLPIMAGFAEEPAMVESAIPISPPAPEVGEQLDQKDMTEAELDMVVETPLPEMDLPEIDIPELEPIAEPAAEPGDPNPALPETKDATALQPRTGGLSGRTAEGRKAMLEKYGGTAASESCVQHALEWLIARQRADGSWDFKDVGPCTYPGTVSNPIGATAYALMPFLAAGQTHQGKDQKYRRQIEAGLNFLISSGISVPAGLDLRGIINKGSTDQEPNEAYYVHGAATLVLCEAYAMTRDRRLRPAAEEAVRFLVNSQDPAGGGWRYVPQQAGSTSVTTIQLMALMSAKKGGIKVPDNTLQGVSHYLDTVQIDPEGRYGYEVQKKAYQISVTAMAQLCRIYLGATRDDPSLQGGIRLIDKRGPYENLYYNYFATQVMRNWGGDEWTRWNERLRDDLVALQEKEGDAKGSWAPRDRDDYSRAGGRLLTTCLATLTLEVYYRYETMLPER